MSSARRIVLAFPGSLDTRSGGYVYDRRLALELEARGWEVERLSLPAGFPFPSPEDVAIARDRLGVLPEGSITLIDGLALGAMPAVAAELSARLDLVALVHHPLCLEAGLTTVQADRLEASERRALAVVGRVVVTSPTTAASLVELLGVPTTRIKVALPGTDPAPLAIGSIDGNIRFLNVGTVTPRKGHLVLIEALAGLEGRWALELAGSLERDPATAAALRIAIEENGIGDRVRLLGELNEAGLAAAYARADLFVSASLYEGYGMAITEALARGLPVVAAAGGAVAATLPDAAGLLVEPGDAIGLRAALRRYMSEPALARSLRRGAVAARDRAAVLA